MKKLSFSLMAALVAALSFTSCHTDGEDDTEKQPTDVVVDMDNATVSDPKLSLASSMGIFTYEWAEPGSLLSPSKIAAYEFNVIAPVVDEAGKAISMGDPDGYYGGIRPSWFQADDEEVIFTPACEEGATPTFKSGKGCLVANPGILARAIFRKGLMAMNKKMKGLWINNTWYFDDTVCNGDSAETSLFPALTKGEEIIFSVYGYKFELKDLASMNYSEILKQNKEALNGIKAKQTVTLASCDGEKTTVLRDWTWVDLSDIAECQIFEIDVQLKGRAESEPQMTDPLKIVLIDDITLINE